MQNRVKSGTRFPAHAKLAHVAASLAARLPEQFGDLLAAPRYADDAAALVRIADASRLGEAIRRIPEQEADWLADRLLERWQRIADPLLDPAVAIAGPTEIWVLDSAREIQLEVRTWGIDEGWRAEWSGDVQAGADSSRAGGVVSPPHGGLPGELRAAVRVFGRADGARGVYSALYRASVRRIELELDGERRRLLLRDQTGAAGSGVPVEIMGADLVTGKDGVLVLDQSLPAREPVSVGGCEAVP